MPKIKEYPKSENLVLRRMLKKITSGVYPSVNGKVGDCSISIVNAAVDAAMELLAMDDVGLLGAMSDLVEINRMIGSLNDDEWGMFLESVEKN